MYAVQIQKPGPLENHSIEELPGLMPGPQEVVIDVKAAAVNYPDLLVITGRYQTMPPFPFAPGKEATGVVSRVGTGVTLVKPGDRVLIHVEYGAYATEAIAREDQCMPLPDAMSFVDAVAVGLAAQTAWFALLERGHCRAGEVVLINGVTGAVGLAAAQIALALGATVVASASSVSRAHAMLNDSRCSIIDLDTPDLRNSLRERLYAATGGRGADVVIDTLGGDPFDASLRALAWCGRIVTVGFAAGRIPEIKANYLLVKNISVSGLQWTDYRDREPKKVAQAHVALVDLWERGALHPPIMKTLPLQDFAHALRLIEVRATTGRLVLTME